VLHRHLADLGRRPVVAVGDQIHAAQAELVELEGAGADGRAGELVLAADGRVPAEGMLGQDLEQEPALGLVDGPVEGDLDPVLALGFRLFDE
jgi:hypothetical protein